MTSFRQKITVNGTLESRIEKARLESLDRNKDKLLEYVRTNVIGSGDDTLIRTVYGLKP